MDRPRRLIVVAFRGTQSAANLLDDANIEMVPSDLCAGCLVHAGNQAAWQQVQARVTSAVSTSLAASPGFELVITGHSLGGPLLLSARPR